MIKLDYIISPQWTDKWSDVDLATATEIDLTFRVLLGDVTFLVDTQDFSARWGWIPIIDFTAAMRLIADKLAQADGSGDFEFTESDAKLHFERQGPNVTITSTFASGTATVPAVEFIEAIHNFTKRVASEIVQQYPDLTRNKALRHLLPVPDRKQ